MKKIEWLSSQAYIELRNDQPDNLTQLTPENSHHLERWLKNMEKFEGTEVAPLKIWSDFYQLMIEAKNTAESGAPNPIKNIIHLLTKNQPQILEIGAKYIPTIASSESTWAFSNIKKIGVELFYWGKSIDHKKSVRLHGISPIGTTLVVPKMRHSKGEADSYKLGKETIEHAMNNLNGVACASPSMVQEAWRMGVRGDAEKGFLSPGAELIFALSIENWFSANPNIYQELMKIRRSKPMKKQLQDANPNNQENKTFINTQIKRLGPGGTRYQSSEKFSKENIQSTIAMQGSISQGAFQPIIRLKLDYPSWTDRSIFKVRSIIRTEANFHGKIYEETVYAEVIDADDVDDSGNQIIIQITPSANNTPWLDTWGQAEIITVKGLIAEKLLSDLGTREPWIGVLVTLGKYPSDSTKNPPIP